MSRLCLIAMPNFGNPKVYIHACRAEDLLRKLVNETEEREMRDDVRSLERRARTKRDREGKRVLEMSTRKGKEKQNNVDCLVCFVSPSTKCDNHRPSFINAIFNNLSMYG